MTSLQKDKSTTYKIPAELRPHCPLQQPTQTNYIKNRQALKYWWPAPLPRREGQTHMQHFTHFPINTESRRNILSYCSKYNLISYATVDIIIKYNHDKLLCQ